MGIQVSYLDSVPGPQDGTAYSLTLENDSTQSWTFYMYQKLPGQSTNVFSLAWFCSPFLIVPGNRVTFRWEVDYNFVWGTTGVLRPGMVFHAGGEVDAFPNGANATTFSLQPGPNLSPPAVSPPAGSLVIREAGDVPNATYAVGIGMSGPGTCVTQAGPNLTQQFTPTPNYWIAAGLNVQAGTVLDIQTITNTAEVVFPPNIYSMTMTLNNQNQWS